MNNFKYAVNLQLFGEGAAEGGAGAPAAGEAGNGQTGAQSQSAADAGRTDAKQDAPGADLYAEFEELTAKGGKYADAFAKKAQAAFNRRYASFKAVEEKADRLERFRDTIASDYKDVNREDIDALEKAYLTDARRFADKALEEGRSAEEMAKADYMQRRLRDLEKREADERTRKAKEAEARRFYDSVVRQEQDMLTKYPDFVLADELKNDSFRAMLKSGVTLEDAYFAAHRGELMQKAVAQAQSATVQSIAQKGMRPAETAVTPAAPAVSEIDFSKLSRKEFMKIFNS